MHAILNLLGLAFRAKKVVSGEDFCVEGIRKGEIKYLFLASDAGINTTKKITDKAKYYNAGNVTFDMRLMEGMINELLGRGKFACKN